MCFEARWQHRKFRSADSWRISHQLEQRRSRSLGSATLRFERRYCILAEDGSFVPILDQLHEHQGQFRQPNDANRIATRKEIDDFPKIIVMIPCDDGNAVKSRLKNIMSTARHQAAAHEGYRRQRIERG